MQSVRGTKDLFGKDLLKFNHIVDIAKKFSKLYNFQELSTPIFEFSEVFERNLGDTSDIVMKEIYKFKDRGDRFLSLRPEFTAGIVRSILSNSELNNNFPLKLFSYGPIFRYDRPQSGRQRQFHQINFEYFGNATYLAEIDILQLAYDILNNLNIKNFQLEINSLGSCETRKLYEQSLKEYFHKYSTDLSEDSKIRLEKNVLRILDSKEKCDIKLLVEAPKIHDFFTNEDKEFFNKILEKLNLLNLKYNINQNLVRGLDYYTSTVFEFTTTDLGAQSTILAGGRYNNLMKIMGGKEIPAFGFAAGIERLMLLIDDNFKQEQPIGLVFITENELNFCLKLQKQLKQNDINVELLFGDKVKNQFNIANKINCSHVLVVGENEIKNNKIIIKNLQSGIEEEIDITRIKHYLNEKTNQ